MNARTFMRVPLMIACAVPLAAGLLAGAALPAQASSCSMKSHCYGIALWQGAPTNYGGYGTLNIGACLASPSHQFTDEEMWQGTDNTPRAASWVEEGATMGLGAPTSGGRSWFWADQRPKGGGYAEHFVGPTVYLKASYDMFFYYYGSNEWLVYAGRPGRVSEIGKSVSNPPAGKYLSAGAEITSNSGRATGSVSSLEYLNSNKKKVSGWSGAVLDNAGGRTTTKWVGSGKKEVSFATPC